MKNKMLGGEAVLDNKNFNYESNKEDGGISEKLSSIFDKEKISEVYTKFKSDSFLMLLEGGDKSWGAFEKYLDFKADVANKIFPAASKFVTGFILPAHLGKIIDFTVEKGTRMATFLGKNFSKISTNVFLLGGPAWVDAIRRNIAIRDSNEDYKKSETSEDLIQGAFINSLGDEDIKKEMEEYCDLRSELDLLRENPQGNEQKLKELAEDLSFFELRYKDNLDFINLKNILTEKKEFSNKNDLFINGLAIQTAEEMILNIENYYKNKLGDFAGKVEGNWSKMANSEDKKNELIEAISQRLRKIMQSKLESDSYKQEMEKVEKDLVSAFGGYRKYMKAVLYTMLGGLPLAKIGMDELGVWDPIAEKIHEGGDYIEGKMAPAMQWMQDKWDGLWDLCKDHLEEGVKGYIKEKATGTLDSAGDAVKEKLAEKSDSMVNGANRLADFLGYKK